MQGIGKTLDRFRLFPVRSPLLRECPVRSTGVFSFPPLTEMFHFSGYATALCAEIPNAKKQTSKNNQILKFKL